MSKITLSVSFILAGLMPVLSYAAPTTPQPVYMTSQIQRLLNEKQEKMSKLEECDGKRKGFMIAGISTLGLTAVGVGVNIAQASKSNKLSNQIADQTLELEKQQNNLANINAQISEKQSDKARQECEAQEGKIYVNGQCLDRERYECDQNPDKEWKDGKCVDKEKPQQPQQPQYDGKIGDSCGEGKVWFVTFNNPTKKCLGMSGIVSCDCIPGERYDGIIGNPCTSNGDGSVWTEGGDKKCLVAEGSKESVACSCKKPSDAVVIRDPNPAVLANPNPTPTVAVVQNPTQNPTVTQPSAGQGIFDAAAKERQDQCHKSGGNYNIESDDCQCRKPGMIQNVNKTKCLCEDSAFEYNETKQECVRKAVSTPTQTSTIGGRPQQPNNPVNGDGRANTALAESILEQKCTSVEHNPMPLVFEYYCVGTTQRKCEELKTAFESAGLPAPEVEFKAEIEEQSYPRGTRSIKNVCVVNLL